MEKVSEFRKTRERRQAGRILSGKLGGVKQ